MRIGQQAPWGDPDYVAKFRRLWADKSLSTAEIGRKMGISKSTVCGKAGRLDLPRRDSPIKARKMDNVLRVAGRHSTRMPAPLPPLPSEEPAVEGPKPVFVKPKLVVAPPAFVGRIRECCWPMSNVGRKWTFCEAPTLPNKDYCQEHHTIGFYKPRVRGEIGGGRSNANADA